VGTNELARDWIEESCDRADSGMIAVGNAITPVPLGNSPIELANDKIDEIAGWSIAVGAKELTNDKRDEKPAGSVT